MAEKIAPPPTILSLPLLEYAWVGDLQRVARSWLFVDGAELGTVPALALCGPSTADEVLLVHCDSLWQDLGMSAHPNRQHAKRNAERIYPGIDSQWIATPYSHAETLASIQEQWTGFDCSVCGRLPPDFDHLEIAPNGARICNLCRTAIDMAT